MMLASMTSMQFHEWMAYYSLEPFGQERADWRQAITSTVLVNANRGKGSKVAKITDFILQQQEPQEQQPQTEAQQHSVFDRLNEIDQQRKGKHL